MTQTETRIFHYDSLGHIIAETNQSGQMLAEYVYLGDQLLAMIKPGESVYYFHNDHLGTPQVLTNDSQAIVWKAAYTPFGEAVVSIATVENPFRFPGQYYDQETGLHYNYFRYYNPQTGRFMTPDPIGLEGGINLFTYVGNNPVKFADPRGLISWVAKEIITHLILLSIEYLIEPSLHKTDEEEWVANKHAERERQLAEERIRESGLREYLEAVEALNKRLNAMVSIYKNEFLKQGCP